ncbi:hypothetical protein [Shimazuella alba]|uniref:Uncharacterized protein n=1 Tax=Shimazuella alba TaxID=2690964 RepID=A0A6I4VVC1_9BACL|nr:hypothetical protein [Shimazuella alba]MXQ54518.1 hypothetical protein [Shimazuella alba]
MSRLQADVLMIKMFLDTLKLTFKVVERNTTNEPPTLKITGKDNLLDEEEKRELERIYTNTLSEIKSSYHTEIKITGWK